MSEEVEISAAASEEAASPPAEATSEAVATSAPDASEEVFSEEAVAEDAPEEASPFDFDDWDGTQDGLPEQYHSIYDRVNTTLQSNMSSIREDLERDQSIYQALLDGEDIGADSRKQLDEISGELEKLRDASTAWGTEKAEMEAKHAEMSQYVQTREEHDREALQRWADDFQREHQHIFSDEAATTRFRTLLEAGIEPEPAVVLMGFPETVTQAATRYAEEGVPAEFAVRHAVMEHQRTVGSSAKPRTSARITAGAQGARTTETVAKSPSDKTISLRDARRIAASRSFAKKSG